MKRVCALAVFLLVNNGPLVSAQTLASGSAPGESPEPKRSEILQAAERQPKTRRPRPPFRT